MMKAERIGAIFVLLLGTGYLWEAIFMEEVTIGDPLGPSFFPLLLGVLMTILGFSLVIKPAGDSAPQSYTRAALSALVLALFLCLYSFAIEWIGYPLSTFLFLAAASRLLGEKSLLAGFVIPLVVSGGIFLLFTRVLSIPLPVGFIGRLWG